MRTEHCTAKCTLWDQSCVVGLNPTLCIGRHHGVLDLYTAKGVHVVKDIALSKITNKRSSFLIYWKFKNCLIVNGHSSFNNLAQKYSIENVYLN